MNKNDLITSHLREKSIRNLIDYGSILEISQSLNASATEVTGIAREINMAVSGIPTVRPGIKPNGSAAAGSNPKEVKKGRVSDLVKSQILKAKIFKSVSPIREDEQTDADFVVTTRGRIRKERKAIAAWIGELTDDVERANAERDAALSQLKLLGKELQSLRYQQEMGHLEPVNAYVNVDVRDPDSFFRLR